ncbi:MAG: DUF2889 domain-containing protein [Smithella sp.]
MKSQWQAKGEKIHSRNIEISTYSYDGQRIIVEGSLKDDRYQESYSVMGEKFPKGVIHHMAIRLLVNCSSLLIEDVDVDMKSIPREFCRETIDCLAQIKGFTITKGFTLQIKKIAGGTKGCIHLVELLTTMAPAVIQGYAAHQSQKPTPFDSDRTKAILHFLTNTCHVWREDGPLVAMFKRKL